MVIATDHPRSRGVYDGSAILTACISGSSPLARGLPADQPGRPVHHRIIPARAGFTFQSPPSLTSGADHPRSRGVYCGDHAAHFGGCGSSPLARGLPDDGHRLGCNDGIIPARAGFTWPAGARCLRSADHPRSRGVYTDQLTVTGNASGSSPLARGLLAQRVEVECPGRIIPARAGFTQR